MLFSPIFDSISGFFKEIEYSPVVSGGVRNGLGPVSQDLEYPVIGTRKVYSSCKEKRSNPELKLPKPGLLRAKALAKTKCKKE